VVPVLVALKVGVCPGTELLFASLSVIVTVEVDAPSAVTGPVPAMVELVALGAAAVNTTVPPVTAVGEVSWSVFVSATKDARVQLETPEAFDAEQAPCELVEPVLVALKIGVMPVIGLLKASSIVIVMNEVATPLAVTGPVPAMVVVVLEAAPAMNVTVPSVFVTGAVMARVFTSALVDFNVQLACPEALVTPHAVCVFPVPVVLNVGVWPGTGLLLASRKVTVMLEVATSFAITGPEPMMVELAAMAAPAVKVTVPSALEIGEVIERVLISATVETSEHVEAPLALVALQAEGVLPVPEAVKTGVVPTTALLLASLNVMVTADVATPSAVTGPVPVMFEFAIVAAPAMNVTSSPVFTTGVAIAKVLISALVDLRVQVDAPEASVALQAVCVLPVPDVVKVGVRPATGLLLASRSVIVIVEVAVSSATTGVVPVMLEFAAIGDPASNTTVPPVLEIGAVMESVFVSAVVDASVHVVTPLALVDPQAV